MLFFLQAVINSINAIVILKKRKPVFIVCIFFMIIYFKFLFY